MDILVLIDKLDDMVHHARPIPLTDQVRVDKQELYDLVDEIRAKLPEAIGPGRSSTDTAPAETAVDRQALTAAVSAAIRENIPAIAQATAAAVGGGHPPQPPPGAPF